MAADAVRMISDTIITTGYSYGAVPAEGGGMTVKIRWWDGTEEGTLIRPGEAWTTRHKSSEETR